MLRGLDAKAWLASRFPPAGLTKLKKRVPLLEGSNSLLLTTAARLGETGAPQAPVKPTLPRCLHFSQGESEGGKAPHEETMGRAKGAKEGSLPASPARGCATLARPPWARRFPGCGLRIHSATPAPPRRAPLTRRRNPAGFFISFCFVSVPAGRSPLPGRQRPLSPPAAPAPGLRPFSAPLTSPRLVLAPALPGPVPSFLNPQ